ncbi:MAG: hypothetical protein AAF348_19100, partial [Bacteroidota bacterium]
SKIVTSKLGLGIFIKKVNLVFLGLFFIGLPIFLKWLLGFSDPIPEINFFGLIITTDLFTDVSVFLWVLSLKLLLYVTLLLLFFTLRKWWRYSILAPILLTTFQIRTIIFPKSEVFDEYEVFESLPLLLIVLVVLLYLSKAAYYQSRLKGLYQTTVSQMEEHKKRLLGDKASQLHQKWKELAHFKSKDTNVNALKDLKNDLERELKKY